ncbi:hypothetical protein HY768_08900 [candidate division TA06 bacterium]|uniref:Uncharacterized protein n=1 Tax=candidate division TA06 bacterium TaxID=2250710 RepID=A0A933IBD6_UNCT6|nr:hypothetical protein [candidate division TA06 bacterium]
MRKNTLFLAVWLTTAGLAAAAEITIDGSRLEGSSHNARAAGQYAQLAGFFTYGAAEYLAPLPVSADRVKMEVSFDNQRGKWLKMYVYNYGTVYDDPSYRNKNLVPNWRLWQATNGTGSWSTKNPEYLYTTSSDGRLDYLGPDNKLKILFYADGGVPYIGDGRFLIKQIKIIYSSSEAVAAQIITSANAWIEGDFLLVRGVGKGKTKIDLPGYESMTKSQALRAARVTAYKNLGIALGKISPKGGTANIPGAKVRSTKFMEDGSAEMVLELPLAELQPK